MMNGGGMNDCESNANILWRLVTQTPGWMLPGKEYVFLQGVSIKKGL